VPTPVPAPGHEQPVTGRGRRRPYRTAPPRGRIRGNHPNRPAGRARPPNPRSPHPSGEHHRDIDRRTAGTWPGDVSPNCIIYSGPSAAVTGAYLTRSAASSWQRTRRRKAARSARPHCGSAAARHYGLARRTAIWDDPAMTALDALSPASAELVFAALDYGVTPASPMRASRPSRCSTARAVAA
jgi:hypothetical protein